MFDVFYVYIVRYSVNKDEGVCVRARTARGGRRTAE